MSARNTWDNDPCDEIARHNGDLARWTNAPALDPRPPGAGETGRCLLTIPPVLERGKWIHPHPPAP